MKRIKLGVLLGLLAVTAYAQEMNCDSTCFGGQLSVQAAPVPKAQTVTTHNVIQMSPTVANRSTKTNYASCPAGFNYYGSSQYPKSETTTITYTRNGQVVGTQVMPEKDLDSDCTAVQYQTLQCPTGQTGSITQTRNVTTGDNGYEYGSWTTTNNSCVANSGAWASLGWQYGKGNPSPYPQCNLYTLRPGGACSPVGYLCAYPDDMTTRVATYQCR